MPSVSESASEKKHGSDAGQRAADHRQEVHQGDPQRPQQRERQAEHGYGDEHDGTCDHRGQQVTDDVAGDRLVDLACHPPEYRGRAFRAGDRPPAARPDRRRCRPGGDHLARPDRPDTGVRRGRMGGRRRGRRILPGIRRGRDRGHPARCSSSAGSSLSPSVWCCSPAPVSARSPWPCCSACSR
jgi:hypothetical protein